LNGTKIKKNSQMANWALVFITVKNNFGFEKYLDKIKNFEQRRTSTRFRISAHKLTIETGRYKGIPRHDRICTRCTDNTVEDERHFLFSCIYHTQEREALMSIINENCKNFSLLNIDLFILKNMGVAIIDFRVCPPLVK
jgi:hypothetical protein